MGLFSKKDYTCERCGKIYQSRFGAGFNLCDTCMQEDYEKDKQEKKMKEELKASIKGYVQYGKKVLEKDYTIEEMQQIKARKEQVLEQFSIKEIGISDKALQNASDNFMSLSDEECLDVLLRVSQSRINTMPGIAYNEAILLPTEFEKVIVPMHDVFAIGFATDYSIKNADVESIVCAFFTNDPYVPVLSMQYVARKGFFDVVKSKKGREALIEVFSEMCPNLPYPIDDLKVLEKTIKRDGNVKGNIEYKTMLKMISDARYGVGIHNTENMVERLNSESEKMINEINYISDNRIDFILKLDKLINRKFWEGKMKKYLC